MRDGASGRSRGFGFLTFKDARTVNIVMVKEHYLDGKIVRPDFQTPSNSLRLYPSSDPSSSKIINARARCKIDPKRAIPRDEQERTSKIFVGGVSQEATEQDFKEYFMQFGRVVDATLMMDKDTEVSDSSHSTAKPQSMPAWIHRSRFSASQSRSRRPSHAAT